MTDLLTTTPRPTPRPRSREWRVGDIYTDPRNGIRWVIRILIPATGAIELETTNTAAPHKTWWRTTLDNLPTKGTDQ